MRGLAAALVGLLAVVLLPLALTAVWLHVVMSDTDAYVQRVAPLAQDAHVQAAVEDEVVAALLGARVAGASAAGAGLTEDRLRPVAHLLVGSPTFADLWTTAQRSTHRQVLSSLRSDSPLGSGTVDVRLDEVVDQLADRLASFGVSATTIDALSSVDVRVPVTDAATLQRARPVFRTLDARWWVLAAVAAAAGVAAVLLARRRVRALAVLAVGAVLTTLVLWLAARVAARAGDGLLAWGLGEDLGDGPRVVVARRTADVLGADLERWALTGAVVAAGVALVAVVAELARAAVRGTRRRRASVRTAR